jgi:hypothetical protein
MGGFDYVFSLFGLLLGLSLTEVLSGLSRVFRARQHIRLGWLTPLTGLLLMTDLVSFWSNAWEMRSVIPAGFGALVFAAAIASVYYLAASLVFPKEPADWPDLDQWYMLRRREVIGGVAAANLLMIAGMMLLLGNIYSDARSIVSTASFFAAAAIIVVTRRKWLIAALTLADISFYWVFRYL